MSGRELLKWCHPHPNSEANNVSWCQVVPSWSNMSNRFSAHFCPPLQLIWPACCQIGRMLDWSQRHNFNLVCGEPSYSQPTSIHCICICIQVYMYVCVCLYLYVYVCVLAYMCIYMYVYKYIYIYICTYLCIYTCTHVYMYVCMYVGR